MIEEGKRLYGENERNITIIHEDDKIMLREYVQKRLMERKQKDEGANTTLAFFINDLLTRPTLPRSATFLFCSFTHDRKEKSNV